jgi:hypothetical protein
MLNVAGAYLAAHPALEVPALLVTHQQAQTLHDALATAMSNLNAAWSSQRNLKSGRDTAESALRDRLGNLFNELSQFMEGDDPRWLEFGFNVPEDGEMPDLPEDLTVTPAGAGHLLATWTPGLRSARFHVFKQVVNVDPDFVFVETVTDPTADLNTFTPGQHVKVQVTAVNDAGETQPTEPVEAVVT